jgi:hypothetical protein
MCELGRSPPVDSNELFDIATSFASGEEAVGAIFDGKKGKRVDDAPAEGSKSKEPQQKNKRGKKEKNPRREAREQGRDDDGDEALAVDPARRGPRLAPRGPGVFNDMLKKPCPYHKMPVNHTLEQCDMLKRFYGRAAAKDDEAKKDGGDGDVGGLPAVENVFLIFGGPTVDMSSRQRKRERHKVLAAENAPPSFLDWSEDAITFSREDHPNRIPNPGQYPLVVDPIIGNARFSKVLMDGGSSLNILYAHTLRLLGIGLDQLRPSTTTFHGVAPGKRVQPLGQIDLPVWFGMPDNFRKETLTFEVVGFRGAYHAILGRSCYAKFMAVPNYTYHKMKMLGPNGVITVGSSSTPRRCHWMKRLWPIWRSWSTRTSTPPPSTPAASRLPSRPKRCPSTLCPRGQGVEGQFHPRPEIGSGAHRLPPCQHRHLCVEPLGHARHFE